MQLIPGNYKISSRYFSDSLQLTNCVLDSVATCHTTPQVSYFILGLLEYTDKYIEVTYGNFFMAEQKGKFQIIMCDDNGYPFIATLHNIISVPDLCNGLFLIITLINFGHTCLFQKWF